MKKPAELHFAWRGWMLACLWAGVVWVRLGSERELAPWGLGLVVLAGIIRVAAAFQIGGHANAVSLMVDGLSTRGLYAFSRNPLYISNIVAAEGLLAFSNCLSPLLHILILAVVALHHHQLVKKEEAFLSEEMGDIYFRYQSSTPRWLGLGKLPGTITGKTTGLPMREAPSAPRRWREVLGAQWRNLAKSATAAAILWGVA